MLLRRILRALNVLLVVLVLVAAGAVYWFLIRPAPRTSGSLVAPVSGDLSITRDKLGVPHILAASIDDALFAQGFVTAQDRMWQMDMMRRYQTGELSEVLGRSALELDTTSRKLRTRHLADEALRRMPASDRAAVAAYSRGVNYYLESHRGNLPPEFLALGYEPRPWRPADCVLAGMHMYRAMTAGWERELTRQKLFAGGDPLKVRELFPLRSGQELAPGSNAWAISGAWTASGKPILASDPHLEWSMPSAWHQVHLQAPGLNVIGVAVPGLPGVAIGHNERIAWGITSLEYDEMDLFDERIDPRNGIYLFGGQPRAAHRETEMIAVKGERPVPLINWITHHGPIFASENGHHYALAWTAALPS